MTSSRTATQSAHSWEIAPAPIEESQIGRTFETDILIIGGGITGFSAAATAAEDGAEAILISKAPGIVARGGDFAAVGTKQQQEGGWTIDKDQITADILDKSHYKSRHDVVRIWVDESGEAFDWLTSRLADHGISMRLDAAPQREDWRWVNYPTCHTFVPQSVDLGGNQPANMATDCLRRIAEEGGVDVRFSTRALQLLREDCPQGRVLGCIAQGESGEYQRFLARKGVILATGGYEHDAEMKEHFWDAESQHMNCQYETKSATGDGHKMAAWIGAALEEPPHATMKFDWSNKSPRNIIVARQPWLYVNALGKRFMNEDCVWDCNANGIAQQPGNQAYSIWDAKWRSEAPGFHAAGCKRLGGIGHEVSDERFQQFLDSGAIVQADTLEELAQLIGVPQDSFLATVSRYNALARAGHDDDFGKSPLRLSTIEQAPFFAGSLGGTVLVCLGGLLVDGKLRVLDTDGQAIPGLYAAGNVSGNFFRNGEYLSNIAGLSLGRCVTFGRVAVRNIQEEALHPAARNPLPS